jgi:hypothetical protein
MTIFSQRFKQWNSFLSLVCMIGMYYDMNYILTSWKLGWWEIGAKLCVFQEVSFSPHQKTYHLKYGQRSANKMHRYTKLSSSSSRHSSSQFHSSSAPDSAA